MQTNDSYKIKRINWNHKIIISIRYEYLEAPVVWWLPLWSMESVLQVQILDEIVCIYHDADNLRKGMNPTIIRPAMGKQ